MQSMKPVSKLERLTKIISFEIIIRLRDIKDWKLKKEHHRNKDKENKEKCIDEISLKNLKFLFFAVVLTQ